MSEKIATSDNGCIPSCSYVAARIRLALHFALAMSEHHQSKILIITSSKVDIFDNLFGLLDQFPRGFAPVTISLQLCNHPEAGLAYEGPPSYKETYKMRCLANSHPFPHYLETCPLG